MDTEVFLAFVVGPGFATVTLADVVAPLFLAEANVPIATGGLTIVLSPLVDFTFLLADIAAGGPPFVDAELAWDLALDPLLG